MARVMMRLGIYKFSLDTAAYQELQRSASYRWARQERIGSNDALQFTGIGPETVDLRGVVFPLFRGGLDQVNKMRLQASIGLPLPMIDGLGKVWGLWVVEQISERQSVFMERGAAKRIEFDMRLSRYDGGLRALLPF
ncbi:phage tail protein [Paracoccus aestuariivivens]|uniref:Phage tail protein n=1 Tax=Paracoccus aestuariivivens TaxID=1820333 RepID=A0A6L6JFV3_9RHOB|nr:phage tail protein [Paracoccus aestuariivivens]MTH78761.1 phage tail protein [Paracoccus aestuariivivens]